MSELINSKENKYEKVILAYLLKDKSYIRKVLDLGVKRDCFSDKELKSFFEIIMSYYFKYEAILTKNVYMDIVRSVKDIDPAEHMSYFNFYDTIEANYKDDESFEFYVNEFKEDSLYKRSLLVIKQYIEDHDRNSKNNSSLIDEVIKKFGKIRFQTEGKRYDIIDYINDVEQQIEDLRNRKEHPELYSGVKTHIPSIDKYFNGFEKGTLNVVAGMTGTGKSTLMKEFARRQCMMGRKNVLIVSCEDDMTIWSHKVTSSEIQIPLSNLLRGEITDSQLDDIIKFKTSRIDVGGYKIIELPARKFTVPEIEMIIDQNFDEWVPDIIFIDQISLILPVTFKGERIDSEFGEISKMLRAMAKKFKIPLVAASQVNRKAVKERKGERHVDINTENLAQSDEIGQDADSIFAIQLDSVDETACTVKLLKQRNGPTNINVPLYFHKTLCCFLDKEFEIIHDVVSTETISVGKDSIKDQVEELLKNKEAIDGFLKDNNEIMKTKTENDVDAIIDSIPVGNSLEEFMSDTFSNMGN